MPVSVSGQRGQTAAFNAVCAAAIGFALSDEEAFVALADWNAACLPPWSEIDLRRKIASARRDCKRPSGYLLGDQQSRCAAGVPRPCATFTLGKPSKSELEPFRMRRGLSMDAIRCAVSLDALRVGTHSQFGKCVALAETGWWQARPLEGQTFRNGCKSMSKPGPAPKFFGGSWLGDCGRVILVEGCIGWLEGVDAILRTGSTDHAVLSAYNCTTKFADDLVTLGRLAGRRITIIPDAGKTGADAALKWDDELTAVGIESRFFLLPDGVGDLGGLLKHPDSKSILRDIFQ